MSKYVGTSMKRREDPRFIQGKGNYVGNISLPNMAHLAVKRSPYAHARIKKINTQKAAALPGVIAVFTGQDLIDGGVGKLPCGWNVPNIKVPTRWPLMVDKVRHVGDGVAAVVAESPYIAADALDLIEVDYEALPAVVDARKATDPGAPLIHEECPGNVSYTWGLGDKEACDKAFAEAEHVVELELVNQRLIPNAMEPRAAVAQWSAATEEMTLWTTSQNPHPIRLLLSAFTLGIPENKLRVVSPDVGGGFGSKIFHYPEEIITPWVARKINRPVKWVATRTEASMTDSQGRDHVTKCKLALKKDGTITGIHVQTWSNQGAYLSTFAPLIPTALYITLLSGLYKVKGIWGEMWGTITNTARAGPRHLTSSNGWWISPPSSSRWTRSNCAARTLSPKRSSPIRRRSLSCTTAETIINSSTRCCRKPITPGCGRRKRKHARKASWWGLVSVVVSRPAAPPHRKSLDRWVRQWAFGRAQCSELILRAK